MHLETKVFLRQTHSPEQIASNCCNQEEGGKEKKIIKVSLVCFTAISISLVMIIKIIVRTITGLSVVW